MMAPAINYLAWSAIGKTGSGFASGRAQFI
jgi:hypothetical protein